MADTKCFVDRFMNKNLLNVVVGIRGTFNNPFDSNLNISIKEY